MQIDPALVVVILEQFLGAAVVVVGTTGVEKRVGLFFLGIGEQRALCRFRVGSLRATGLRRQGPSS